MKNIQEKDVVIVGAGLAGLYTALCIDKKYEIEIIIKDNLINSNSILAQGGIAGELNFNIENLNNHIEDTLKAGSYLNNEEMVKILVHEAKENIEKLINFGVDFDKDEKKNILLTKEGGHSSRRILHSGGDATGKGIIKALIHRVLSAKNIKISENSTVLDIITSKNAAKGVVILDRFNNTKHVYCEKVILATGGIGSVYGLTTNSLLATCDGIGMAFRAGADINNMEFVQFHPTALFAENNRKRQKFLISEAVRGEGAVLLNIENERFMTKYHKLKDLAPRDIVSQSIIREMYDTWADHIYLDTRHLDHDFLKNRFPTIYNKCKEHDIILGKDLIPVSPVEHFSVGGVTVDRFGKSSVDNLYANGECADTGVHGANRLASNSLLECIVFGNRIASDINRNMLKEIDIVPFELDFKTYKYNYSSTRKKIGNIMDEYAGIIRTKEGLETAFKLIDRHYLNLLKHKNLSKYYFETLNLATTAKIIIKSSLNREDSIGCHYRIN